MMLGLCNFCRKKFRKREKKYKFCSLTCANRFNRNGLNNITLPNKSSLLAEFIGICLGDGHTSKYQTGITLNSKSDKEYLMYVFDISKKLFPGATISFVSKKGENATDVRINSIIVADFLRKMGIVSNAKTIPSWILNKSIYKKACIRGLFDTEGSISFKKHRGRTGISLYKQLNFRNIDVKLMTFVRDNLLNLGLKPTMTLKKSLYLSNDASINAFRKLIGFNNPKLLKRSLTSNIDSYRKLQ